jgi:hypothetical protein
MAPNDDPPAEPQPPAPEGGELGFQSGGTKRPERYNTQFLVANFEKEERRTRLIILGVALVCAVLIGVGLTVGKDEVKKPEPNAAAMPEGAPAEAKPAVAPNPEAAKPAEPAKPAEAPKPAEPAKPAEAPKP